MDNLSKITKVVAFIILLIIIFSANFNTTNYIICHHIIFVISVYSIWTAVAARKKFWLWCFCIIAFLFNPVFLIPPPNTLIGFVIILSTAALFAISVPLVKSPKKDKEKIGFIKELGMIIISISTLLILTGIHDAIVDWYGNPKYPQPQSQRYNELMDVTEQYYQSQKQRPVEPAGKFHFYWTEKLNQQKYGKKEIGVFIDQLIKHINHYLIPKEENRIYRGDPIWLILLGVVFMIGGIILFEKKKTPTKICPYCAEKIKVEAIVCRYCSRDLPGEETKIS